MRLHIQHETLYRYERPIKYSVQRLHLTPRPEPSQRVIAWRLEAPGSRVEQLDAHGNVTHLLTIEDARREICISVRGIVDTSEQDLSPEDGPLSPLAYLAETPLTRADPQLRAFAGDACAGRTSAEAIAHDLCEAICATIRYRPGSSEVGDSASAAFAARAGVCQDQAHVFLACARARGLPARYVSGYLYTGDASEVASHAWVDVWLGAELGWRSLDVTHRRPAQGRYCRLAVGRDYLDAAPVRGVRHGGGDERLAARVQVAGSAQEQQ
ncbi:MAG: transglutaminase family protein [Gammaproteobacteria bacterium]|nr:transglutaminase family protein [Gammaproteobacteria bacterium]